ncbi:MAG TPA: plastocyanin/azurin family copper-binding protein [Candidatus Limnocylindrales bacterium]|nr:plastocyanin/azurin family copper-binding protein [Candidatus Limnocylindrales bacterium]
MTFSRRAGLAGALALAVLGLLALAWAPTLAAGPNAISIVGTTFQPSTLTVNVGDTVTWTVTQAVSQPHSVTSGTGPDDPNSGKLFDSGIRLQNNGDSFPFTFTAPGTYPFYCQVHPTTMTGTITVVGPGGSGAPAPSTASSAAPTGSGAPAASGAPAGSAAPTPSALPGAEAQPVPTANKVAAAGILGGVLVLLFGAAWVYRRMNG